MTLSDEEFGMLLSLNSIHSKFWPDINKFFDVGTDTVGLRLTAGGGGVWVDEDEIILREAQARGINLFHYEYVINDGDTGTNNDWITIHRGGDNVNMERIQFYSNIWRPKEELGE